MKKIILSLAVVLSLSACTSAPFMPSQGIVYSNTKAPLSLEYKNTDLGNKVGKASTSSILGLFAFGDASTHTAARDGRIKTIKHTDYEFTNVLFGAFTNTTVYVYGD